MTVAVEVVVAVRVGVGLLVAVEVVVAVAVRVGVCVAVDVGITVTDVVGVLLLGGEDRVSVAGCIKPDVFVIFSGVFVGEAVIFSGSGSGANMNQISTLSKMIAITSLTVSYVRHFLRSSMSPHFTRPG